MQFSHKKNHCLTRKQYYFPWLKFLFNTSVSSKLCEKNWQNHLIRSLSGIQPAILQRTFKLQICY